MLLLYFHLTDTMTETSMFGYQTYTKPVPSYFFYFCEMTVGLLFTYRTLHALNNLKTWIIADTEVMYIMLEITQSVIVK